MYEFNKEAESNESKFKKYLILYMISSFINLIFDLKDLLIGTITLPRFIIYALCYGFILYSGLKRKQWAIWLVKLVVWLNILLLILILVTAIKSFLL